MIEDMIVCEFLWFSFVFNQGLFEYVIVFYFFINMMYFDVNFLSNSDVFDFGDVFCFYVDLVKIYIEFNLEKCICIIGYIDNVDIDCYN